jgi:hypothetical protein
MLTRLCTSFNHKKLGLVVASGSLLLTSELEMPKFFWGFGSKKKSSDDKTQCYSWGNGHYQSKPGRSIQFSNFKPHKIRTFNGSADTNPYIK